MAHKALEVKNINKYFGNVIALNDINMSVSAGEVHCLLGDNGAGKSTMIRILSGVHQPDSGEVLLEGEPVTFATPADALDRGIATVHQYLSIQPLMSVTRNFFLGREPTVGWGPLKRFDLNAADAIVQREMASMGIDVRDPSQPVGTMSGGERQCVAISRAISFAARAFILDEPTSALGVKLASTVLRYIARARKQNLAVIFITHNVHHAYAVGDTFTVFKRGSSLATHTRDEITREELLDMMAGGQDFQEFERQLAAELGEH